MLAQRSLSPLEDRETLFRWAVATAAIGNYDAHAKNIIVLYVQGDRVRLAPAYDVVVTAVFPELDRTFALTFAGTTHPSALNPVGLSKAAREFQLSERRAQTLVAAVVEPCCRQVRSALLGA